LIAERGKIARIGLLHQVMHPFCSRRNLPIC
jgi:hypothetical protein